MGESSKAALENAPLITGRGKDKSPAHLGGYGAAAGSARRRPFTNDNDQDFIEQEDTQLTQQCRLRLCLAFVLLLGLSCVAALFLLLMTPDFAQRSLADGIEFQFKEASIINATENGSTQLDLTLHVAGQLVLHKTVYDLSRQVSRFFGDIQIEPSTVQVFHGIDEDQQRIGAIELPPLVLSSTSNLTTFDFITRFSVSNVKALVGFCEDAVASKTVAWQIEGPVAIKAGWLLSTRTQIDKQVLLDGMDGLKQAEIQDVQFPGAHPLGGIALSGRVGIYNPSRMLSLPLGDVDFAIYLADENGYEKVIAVVRAHDAKLLGDQQNWFNISGRSMPFDDGDDRGKQLMEKFLSAYLHGNTTTVHVRGSSFGPDDLPQDGNVPTSSTPAWLRKALESLSLKIPFPGTSDSNLIRSLELSDIKIDFSDDYDEPLVSAHAMALLKRPDEMNFSLNVTEIRPQIYLYLHEDSERPFGRLIPTKPCPAETYQMEDDPSMFKVVSQVERAPFSVMPGMDDDFQKFLENIFHGRRSKVYIRGTSDAQVDSAFGHLAVHGLSFKGEIETKGMEGMKNPPPEVTSIALKRGHPDALEVLCSLVISNPSNVDVNLGLLRAYLIYDDKIIGESTIPELKLEAETKSELIVEGRLFKEAPCHLSPMVEFIGNYISGDGETKLAISGRHPNATLSKLLWPLVQQFEFTVSPPPFQEAPLLADMRMNILSSTTILWLRNPFEEINIEIVRLDASATYRGHQIGTAHANFEDPSEGWPSGPVVLPPPVCSSEDNCTAVVIETPKIPVMTKKFGFEEIKKALGGEIEISVESMLDINIDQLVLQDLRYQRSNLTAKISKGF